MSLPVGTFQLITAPLSKMWSDVLTKPLQGNAFKEMRAMLMNFLVDYVDSCTKDTENISGVSKPYHFPITSRLMKHLENKVCFMDSPQEYFGGVPKQ